MSVKDSKELEVEPIFNHKKNFFSSDMLEDWLYLLTSKNSEAITKPAEYTDCWSTQFSVEFIFNACNKLNQPIEVKYLALEIFDRFLIKHVEELYNSVQNSLKTPGQAIQWDAVESRIHNQLVLRVTSCIQLASKVNSHYDILTPIQVQEFLTEAGYSYRLDSILKSELRILRTLEYSVNIITPLTYLELLLEVLAHNDPYFEPNLLYDVCVKLLEFTYICRNNIYDRLYKLATDELETQGAGAGLLALKSDYLLLTVSIIAAASHFAGEETTEQIIKQLQHITRIPYHDIKDFCQILVEIVEEEEEEDAPA